MVADGWSAGQVLPFSDGPLERGVLLDFLDGGKAQQDFAQAVVTQGPVADLARRRG
jgi:hypothetical protein